MNAVDFGGFPSLATMRQSPRYGPILDISLKLYGPPDADSHPITYTGSIDNKPLAMACSLPAVWQICQSGGIFNVEAGELSALIDGFDSESDTELANALGAHPNYIDAVWFGHSVAVALGLTPLNFYSQT